MLITYGKDVVSNIYILYLLRGTYTGNTFFYLEIVPRGQTKGEKKRRKERHSKNGEEALHPMQSPLLLDGKRGGKRGGVWLFLSPCCFCLSFPVNIIPWAYNIQSINVYSGCQTGDATLSNIRSTIWALPWQAVQAFDPNIARIFQNTITIIFLCWFVLKRMCLLL